MGFPVTTSLKVLWLGILRLNEVSQQMRGPLSLRLDAAGVMWTENNQLYVPDHETLYFQCLESVLSHPRCHAYQEAEQLYHWPRLSKDIVKWVGSCNPCLRNKAVRHKLLGKLNPTQVPERRWEYVSMVFVTDLPVTPQGNDSIWVVVD